MRITIVQGAFLPVPPVLGGAVEKVWFGLGKEFAARGHRVVHISRQYGGLAAAETIDGVEHIRVPGFDTPASGLKLKLLDLAYSLRVLGRLPEADVLVTNTFFMPLLARNTRRNGDLYVHVARFPKGQMFLYRHARRVQAVSTVVGDAIRSECASLEGSVRVIPNPLPYPLGEPPGEETREKWILYTGRIHPEKGIGLLLSAFARLVERGEKEHKLVIIGPWQTQMGGGGESYRAELMRMSSGVGDRVVWKEPIFVDNDLVVFYKQASVFAYPSLAEKGESFGLAPLEAMAYGTIPVVSALGCFRDFIEDGVSGLVFDHRGEDPADALADKLSEAIRLSANPQVRRQCYNVACRFSLPLVAERYLSDFEALRTS